MLAPLVYAAAILLLLEDWLWDVTARALAWFATWPPLRALENAIARLSPYWALATFILPALLLFPVKIMALLALSHGHAWLGLAILASAKIGGAALTARLYLLTRPALMSLPWFARWLSAFISFKNRLIARLHATHAWHTLQRFRIRTRRLWQSWRHALQRHFGEGKLLRLLKRFRERLRRKTRT